MQLEAARAAAGARGTRVVVAVAEPAGAAADAPPLPPERAQMLSRAAGVPPGCVVCYAPGDGGASRATLAALLAEQAAAHCGGELRRRAAKYAPLAGEAPAGAALRIAFKLGALAELARDWPAAAAYYREAYSHVPAAALAGGDAPLQRFVEARALAELVAARLAAALLLGARRPAEAAAALDAHLRMLREPPLAPAPPLGLAAEHAGWVARQLAAAARLGAGAAGAALPPHARPVPLLLAAADADAERRALAARVRERGTAAPPPGVAPGVYLGQFVLAGPPPRRLTDLEFLRHVESVACAADAARPALAYAEEAAAALAADAAAGRRPAARLAARVALRVGQERLAAGRADGAAEALAAAAAAYRHERWGAPLAAALGALREAEAARDERVGAALAALEASALLESGDAEARRALAAGALPALLAGAAKFAADAADSPWLGILSVAAGFLCPRGGAAGGASPPAAFGLALRCVAPVALPFLGGAVTFEDADGAFEVELRPLAGAGASDGGVLPPGAWRAFVAAAAPRRAGSLKVASTVLRLGPGATLALRAPALFKEQRGAAPAAFPASAGFRAGRAAVEVPPRHERPALELRAAAPALAGEPLLIEAHVVAGADALAGARLELAATRRFGDAASPLAAAADSDAGGEFSLAPREARSLLFRLPPQPPGEVALAASLSYSTAGGAPEAGAAAAAALLDVVAPLELALEVRLPPRAATLPPPADAGDASEALSAQLRAHALDEAAKAPLAPGALAALSRLPSYYRLPAGQALLMAATVRSAAPCALELVGAALEAAGGAAAPPAAGLRAGEALPLACAGDAAALVFALPPRPAGDVGALGRLRLALRRARGGREALDARGGAAAPAEAGVSDAAAPPGPDFELLLPLPGAAFRAPLLAVAVEHPPEGVLGEPLVLALRLASGAPAAEEVALAVGGAGGWMVGGPRGAALALPPGGAARVEVTLVPYHAGLLALPSVQISLGSGGALAATDGCAVFVRG